MADRNRFQSARRIDAKMFLTVSLWMVFAVSEIQPTKFRRWNLFFDSFDMHPNYNLLHWNKSCGEQIIKKWPDEEPQSYMTGSLRQRGGQFPWVVLLKPTLCAGALINQWWVVSSAQCSATNRVFFQYLDARSDYDYKYFSRERKVSDRIIHENYTTSDNRILHDIMLIQLDRVIGFSDYIQPFCMVPTRRPTMFYNQDITMAGWGTNKEVPVLDPGTEGRYYNTRVAPNTLCEDEWAKENFTVYTLSQLCTLNWVAALCKGDEGAPMLTRYTPPGDTVERAYLLGIFIHGYPCNPYSNLTYKPKTKPGIYTDISFYLFWILDNIKDYPSDTVFQGLGRG